MLAHTFWGFGLIFGWIFSTDFQTRPAKTEFVATEKTPLQFPESPRLNRDGHPVIVMFVHPYCSCSRASLHELANVLSTTQREFRAYVLFYSTDRFKEPLEQSELWKKALQIPHVIVQSDQNGEISRSFGAFTSGSVVVYDSTGRLTFAGGITQSRGHIGQNSGAMAVMNRLQRDVGTCDSAPVYGCPIISRSAPRQEIVDASQK